MNVIKACVNFHVASVFLPSVFQYSFMAKYIFAKTSVSLSGSHILTNAIVLVSSAYIHVHIQWLQACQLSRVYRESHGFTTLLKGSRSNLTVFEKS